MIEVLKAVLFGIVEGITEWLPVSSTGHLILLNEFINLNVSEEFQSMFDVVIQLGAILAVFPETQPLRPGEERRAEEADLDAVVQGDCRHHPLRRCGRAV